MRSTTLFFAAVLAASCSTESGAPPTSLQAPAGADRERLRLLNARRRP